MTEAKRKFNEDNFANEATKSNQSEKLRRSVIGTITGLFVWDHNTITDAISSLTDVDLTKIVPTSEAWEPILDTYMHQLQTHMETEDPKPNSTDQLLSVGKILAPYFGANIRRPGEITKVLESINLATELAEGQAVSPKPDERVKEIQTALALVFIEEHAKKRIPKYSGKAFLLYQQRPDITIPEIEAEIKTSQPQDGNAVRTRKRQLVYLHDEDRYDQIIDALGITWTDILTNRNWLAERGLIAKKDTKFKMGEVHGRKRNEGLYDRIAELYNRGLPLDEIGRRVGRDPKGYISILIREERVVGRYSRQKNH